MAPQWTSCSEVGCPRPALAIALYQGQPYCRCHYSMYSEPDLFKGKLIADMSPGSMGIAWGEDCSRRRKKVEEGGEGVDL